MSAGETIHGVETSVADAQAALGVIHEGLAVAGAVADEVDRAWLSLRNLIRLLLVLLVVGALVAAVRKARQAN
ncbi:MAG: hypothetical protein OES57_04360 [Acidimicrobiia bacterium]|nr:hypothetical protein [Acidimicrobiia bacterium]